jgi:undecaprenyl-diphosphatase
MLSLILSLDHKIFFLINSHHCIFGDIFFETISWLGNGWILVPILIIISIIKIPKNKLKLFFIFTTCGFICSSVINTQIKNVVNRERPPAYFEKQKTNATYYTQIHIVGDTLRTRSFPSGHANTAFCGASILSFFLGGWYWLSFILAFFVAYSRVYMGIHFPSDVVFGGILALIIMYFTSILYKFALKKQRPI